MDSDLAFSVVKVPGKSRYLLAVTGLGHVGRSVANSLESHFDLLLYDVKMEIPYPEQQISKCTIDFICVGTPMNSDGSCDTSYVEAAVKRSPAEIIVLKSTVPPGTTDRLIIETGKKIIFSPEYYGEGSHSSDFWESHGGVGFSILGGDLATCSVVADLLAPVVNNEHKLYLCQALDAEIIKYMENSYLATKVAFVNEFYDLVQQLGGSWAVVREGWLLDPRINRSHSTVFVENRGFGGRCLPKDVAAIAKVAEEQGIEMNVLMGAIKTNTRLRGEEQ